MIKLQLLLSHPKRELAVDPVLCAQLAALGMTVTGSGMASVSAEIAPDAYQRLFGPPPPLQGGFAPSAQAAPALPVPPELAGAVALITIAPRHVGTT